MRGLADGPVKHNGLSFWGDSGSAGKSRQINEHIGGSWHVAREYLSSIDTALLQLEDPTNPMMVTAVMIFGSAIDYEHLKATIRSRLLRMQRFRQRVSWSRLGHGRPYWREDPDFDLNYHLQRASLRPPGDRAALQEVASLLASTPLDLGKPPWQVYLIEGYEGGCALVWRFHHSIADGMALAQVVLSMTDADPDAPWPVHEPESTNQRRRGERPAALTPSVLRHNASRWLQEGFGRVTDPAQLPETGRIGAEAALDLGRFLLLKPDPDTVLMGRLGEAKQAAWSDGISLEEIRTVRRRLGGTVNDVLLAVIAGALRRYLQAQGEPVDALSLRAAVPVSMRSPEREGELGNLMGAVFVTLPVWLADPACRLRDIEWRMGDRKKSSEAPLFYVLLNVLGKTPAQVAKALVTVYGTRATAVITNVPGPREQRYLAGAALESILAWVPQTGSIGLGISILSYAGQLRVGVLADQGLLPDPEAVLAAFHAEFELLLARAQQMGDKSSLGGGASND
jgi:WS/DGAT/MGAT family acyltransferase